MSAGEDMAKIEVEIKRTEYGFVSVEPDGKKSIDELAYEEYLKGNAEWGNETVDILEPKTV